MLKNSPTQLAVGSNNGSGSPVALRTAFGDLPVLFVSASSNLNFIYNSSFPEDEEGGILGLEEKATYLPVSRIY
jgi:hypothetical protein